MPSVYISCHARLCKSIGICQVHCSGCSYCQYIYQALLSTETIAIALAIIVKAHIMWWLFCFEFKIVLVITYIYMVLGLPNTLSSELTPQKTLCSRLYKRPVPDYSVTNNPVLIGEFFISSLDDSWQQATIHYTPLGLRFASGHIDINCNNTPRPTGVYVWTRLGLEKYTLVGTSPPLNRGLEQNFYI